ncbi:hypothetical protein Tco_0916211, partial [Tanacetum coccineum]
MDDPNITMEEYIRLEEEKARRRGKVFNWETAKYGKIWYDEDVHDLRSVETKFPAIVFNDNLKSNETLSCEPTVSSLNDNEIDFRISFDESDDEDYTISQTEHVVIPQHIDEFDLKEETSLFECNEEEQNVLYFNDLFPFNVIYPHELKSDKDNDDEKIDIKQSSRGNVINTDDAQSIRRIHYMNTAYTCINTAYPEEWIWRIDFLYSFRNLLNEMTTLLEYLYIWKSRSVGVLKSQDGCSTHFAQELNLENHLEQNIKEFFVLILFP